MKKLVTVMVGDFETTVYDNQEETEVWASALVPLYTEDVKILGSIEDTYKYLVSLRKNLVVYYHNLKFDGSFWIDFLLRNEKLKQAYIKYSETRYEFLEDTKMWANTYKYMISDTGQWYTIKIKTAYNKIIEIRDSLKLLPFSVKEIGRSFKTKHQKLDMEYTGYRYANCPRTEEENHYIANDVLVVKEGLEYLYNEGHDKQTIGSCCLAEYKKNYDKEDWNVFFPDLTQVKIDKGIYGSETVDEYIRHSYRGGWCYVKESEQGIIQGNGCTFDVNSLYPSVMHSQSGNRYPVCLPKFWSGNYIPDGALNGHAYYFVRVRTEFYLKENHLPFIQIKGNMIYKGTECLKTSNYKDKNGNYTRYYKDATGKIRDTFVTMTLTMTDYELIKEHYELVNFEILDGCYFRTLTGLFDNYINHYAEIKMNSKGAVRTTAKLFLNNLYGKMAMSNDSSFKVAFMKENDTVGFLSVEEHKKNVGYIPIGSAITSYARNFTIRTAQKNYDVFCYADTDSIHCKCKPQEIKDVPVDNVKFCHWKNEANWSTAIFTRQKTYIEYVTEEDGEPVDEPYYNVKCAGMPAKCKDLFVKTLTGYVYNEGDEYSEEEKNFLSKKHTIKDFDIGLKVPSKLMPVRIKGGVVLMNTTYEMR